MNKARAQLQVQSYVTTRYQLNVLIQELSDAARTFREAADYLERYPESLLKRKRAVSMLIKWLEKNV